MNRFKRPLLILNPAAGGLPSNSLENQCIAALKEWLPALEVIRPKGPDQTAQAAREAVENGSDLVIGGGGDGTVNALLGSLAGSGVVMGILPLGTGNSLARELGLPPHPVKAVSAMRNGTVADVSIGLADDRYFGLMVGIGFDGMAVRQVPFHLKRFLGKIAYVWAGLRTLARYRYPSFRMTIDGKPVTGTTAIIAKSPYYASRFRIAPRASLKDPEFQVLIFKSRNPWRYLVYVMAIMLNRHTTLSDVAVRKAKEVTVEAFPGLHAHMDGDALPEVPSFIRIAGKNMRVLAAEPESG